MAWFEGMERLLERDVRILVGVSNLQLLISRVLLKKWNLGNLGEHFFGHIDVQCS